MKDIYLTVEAFAGTSIDRACEAAINLADQLKIPIVFKFNGERMIAHPGPAMTSHIRAKLLAHNYQK